MELMELENHYIVGIGPNFLPKLLFLSSTLQYVLGVQRIYGMHHNCLYILEKQRSFAQDLQALALLRC